MFYSTIKIYFQIAEIEKCRGEPILKKGKGPCAKRLDELLCSVHVQRQAYHGKSFVGNHVNKMLKVCEHVTILLKRCKSIGYIRTQIIYD